MRRTSPPWLALPFLLVACGASETTEPVALGRVSLRISALWPDGGSPWWPPVAASAEGDPGSPGDPEPVVIGCDRRLGVSTELDNFYLRAPDACGGSPQCGFLSLEIDPDLSLPVDDLGRAAAHVRGTATTLLFDLDPSDAERFAGEHSIHPSLFLDAEHPFKGPYVEDPLDLTVTFAFAECAEGGAGGAGGAGGDTAGQGGAPN